jgi:hypothetical protein
MDLSKLPKLSQTPPSPSPADAGAAVHVLDEPSSRPERAGPRPMAPLAEVWLGVAVGLILLVMYPTTIKYLSSRLFGTKFAPFELDDGTVVPYPKVYPQFWSDLCITAFALVMIVEGLALALARKRGVMLLAFGLTVAATLLNAAYVLATFATYGPPVVSLLAVAVGGYVAIHQWRLLRA